LVKDIASSLGVYRTTQTFIESNFGKKGKLFCR
jgi:hypothetical protein